MASGTLPRPGASAQPNKLAQERSRRMMSTAYLYILPAAIIMLIITVFPLIYQFWMSFTNYSNINLRTDSLIMQMVGAFTGGAESNQRIVHADDYQGEHNQHSEDDPTHR